jgi:voltage-gated potassium channel
MLMEQVEREAYRYIVLAAIFIVVVGTVFYHFVEKWSWINAYYFSVVTLATVGYGDLVPTTDLGKIFTTFYIFSGVGIIATYVTVTAQRRGERFGQHLRRKSK